jgi:hypothetical protein
LLLLCACRSEKPEWARAPAAKHPGEATITGEPLVVKRTAARPKIDGALDDAIWSDAASVGPFVDPRDGRDVGDSPVAGFAKIAWDDVALYVGVVVSDRSPVSPFSRDEVDPHVWGKASGVELMLQPGDLGDNRDYYELQIDVNGAVWDTHFDDYNAPTTGAGAEKKFGHQEWQSHAERGVHIGRNDFYSIEAAIPWTAFEKARVAIPPHGGDVWRMNVYTFRDGQRQALAWSPLRGQGNFHKAARFGRIRF